MGNTPRHFPAAARKIMSGELPAGDARLLDGQSLEQIAGQFTKNLLINGDFDIWQRGTSFTAVGYTADRWRLSHNAASVLVQRGEYPNIFGNYGIVMTLASKGGAFTDCVLHQSLESTNCVKLRGKKITFSIWLYRSAFQAGSFRINIYTGTGTDETTVGSGRVDTYVDIPYSAIGSAEYTQHYVTADVPMNAKQVGVFFRFKSDCPDGAVIVARHARLTVSDGPVECRKRSYGEELALCQRYYEKSYNPETIPGTDTFEGRFDLNGVTESTGAITFTIPFKVTKRKIPTMKFLSKVGLADIWGYSRSGVASSATVVSTNTVGMSGCTAYLQAGAAWVPCIIDGHWTADAEL